VLAVITGDYLSREFPGRPNAPLTTATYDETSVLSVGK